MDFNAYNNQPMGTSVNDDFIFHVDTTQEIIDRMPEDGVNSFMIEHVEATRSRKSGKRMVVVHLMKQFKLRSGGTENGFYTDWLLLESEAITAQRKIQQFYKAIGEPFGASANVNWAELANLPQLKGMTIYADTNTRTSEDYGTQLNIKTYLTKEEAKTLSTRRNTDAFGFPKKIEDQQAYMKANSSNNSKTVNGHEIAGKLTGKKVIEESTPEAMSWDPNDTDLPFDL